MTHADRIGRPPYPRYHGESDATLEHRLGDKLWMLDHDGSTALPCRCLESSPQGVRLAVPPGYGLAVGQEYELRPYNAYIPLATDWIGRAWVRIAQVACAADPSGHLQVEATRLPPG